VAAEKYEQLRARLRAYGSCLVAYSGGVDSAFLACVAHSELGDRSLAVIADSPSLPRRELEDALAIAKQFQFPLRVIRTKEFDNPDYLANPANRCYFCKHELFDELASLAKVEGYAVIAYGENASDVGDYRPGSQAAAEFQVRAPLKEVGLTKAEIRQLSTELGLPTADKPQMACLSSRVPSGEPVTQEKLQMIEQAENVLRDLGFYDVRVRHHELRAPATEVRLTGNAPPETSGQWDHGAGTASSPTLLPAQLPRGDEAVPAPSPPISIRIGKPQPVPSSAATNQGSCLARIEVGPTELPRLLWNGLSEKVAQALKQIGYAHVTVDLQGYRRR
jgi:uncharacterized protein